MEQTDIREAVELAEYLADRPDYITTEHWQEWLDSAVEPEIIAANVRSLSGYDAYSYIGSENMNRLNTGRLASYWLKRYAHIEAGGWWFAGLDPQTLEPMEWGCLKPDRPYTNQEGQTLKYEHPFRTETRIFLPQDPRNPGLSKQIKTDETLPLTITEGAKKAGCLMSCGHAAIGLPGITGAVRKDESTGIRRYRLTPDIAALALPGRRIYILFDHDQKPKTRTAVTREINKLAIELKKLGCEPYIVTLPGPEKGVDDFVVAHGVDALHRLYAQALPHEKWQVQQYSQLTYKPNVVFNQRYLPEDLEIPPDARLVGIKSAKGTGKTQAIRNIVSRYQDEGQRTLMIVHRVQLGQALGSRVSLPFISELHTVEEGDLFGYVLCVDSMVEDSQARFSPMDWDCVVLDESEQIISHALNANTEVSKRRIPILRNTQQLLADVLSKEHGLVICLDADLTDLTFEFINGLAGTDIEPYIIYNEWKPKEEAWTIHHYPQTTPRKLYEAAIEQLQQGKRLIVTTQSQQPKSKWGTCTLEAAFTRLFPSRKFLRIDSETIADPTHPAFNCIPHLNEILPLYDGVIASPSIETGVSIDIRGHFDAVFAFCQGISSENSTRQALARVRESIPRHVWLAKRGLEFVGNGATSIKSLLAAQHKAAKWHIQQLQAECFDLEGETITVNDVALRVWAKMGVRHNAGMIRYRDAVLDGLIEEGHRIVDVTQDIQQPELQEELTAIRDENYQAECEAIVAAADLTDKEAEKQETKKAKTKQEWREQRKHFLQKRYGVDVTTELIEKDDAGWYPKIRLYYLLTVGHQFLKQREAQNFSGAVSKGEVWYPTLNRSQMGLKIALLEFLGVRDIIREPDAEFHKDHPAIAQLATRARANHWLIRASLGISVSEDDSEIAIVQRVLGTMGLKLTYDRREGPRGDRRRIYVYRKPEDKRHEIYGCWLERDELSRNQSAVSTPGSLIAS